MGMRPTSCHLMTRVVCRRSAGAAVSYSIPEAKVVLANSHLQNEMTWRIVSTFKGQESLRQSGGITNSGFQVSCASPLLHHSSTVH